MTRANVIRRIIRCVFWITVVKFDILRREKSSRNSGDLKSSCKLNSHEPVDLSPLVECL